MFRLGSHVYKSPIKARHIAEGADVIAVYCSGIDQHVATLQQFIDEVKK